MSGRQDTTREQISKLRDLDSETSKPRLTMSETKKSEMENRDEKSTKTEVKEHKIKPSTTKSSQTLNSILIPYLRTPLTGKPEPKHSSFVPSAFTMFEIIHIMDDIMRKNSYFKRQEDAWHPFISRLYFGILFFIQTLRAELKAGTITSKNRRFLKNFLKDYPPEILVIPGPLVALFEALDCTKPENALFGTVTPYIPQNLNRIVASDLINYDEGHAYQLILPYIPGILGFIGTILAADPNQIPDYTRANAFDNAQDRLLNGHIFTANNWNETERATLLLPGMLYPLETNRDIDASFNNYGKRLGLPTPNANSPITNLNDFLFLNGNNTWFGNVIRIMGTYCSYFKGSETLSFQETPQTIAPLILNDFVGITTTTPDLNPIHTLTHAFPSQGVFTNEMRHETTELKLPPTLTIAAASSKLNAITRINGLGHFSLIGHIDMTRNGPYWLHFPVSHVSTKESSFKNIGSIVTEKYVLLRPKN